MNDRFKFRVWDKKHNEYIPSNMISTLLYFGHKDGFHIEFECFSTFADSLIIEQCTGLKDKNGNLIYEGDILTEFYNPQVNYIIKWNEKNAKFGLWYIDHFIVGQISRDGGNLCWLPSEFVITGNIHKQAGQKDK